MYYLIEQTPSAEDELGRYITDLHGRRLQKGKWLLRTPLSKEELAVALEEAQHGKAGAPVIETLDEGEAERLLVHSLGPEEPPLEEVGR